jgi:tetratricopeptide (TPR) repeat protein
MTTVEEKTGILKHAAELHKEGKVKEALQRYRKKLADNPDDLEIRHVVGELELKENNTSGALGHFRWLADYYVTGGMFTKAIAMYRRITRLVPHDENALIKLAEVYSKQGLAQEAKHIYLDIAAHCKHQNNQEKALSMYKRILDFDKGNVKLRLLLANTFMEEGLEESAVNEYFTTADYLLDHKDYQGLENLLLTTIKKLKNAELFDKLRYYYTELVRTLKKNDNTAELTTFYESLIPLYEKKKMNRELKETLEELVQLPESNPVYAEQLKILIDREVSDEKDEYEDTAISIDLGKVPLSSLPMMQPGGGATPEEVEGDEADTLNLSSSKDEGEITAVGLGNLSMENSAAELEKQMLNYIEKDEQSQQIAMPKGEKGIIADEFSSSDFELFDLDRIFNDEESK